MKAADIVQALALRLPAQTSYFTDNIAITSLTQSAGVATAVTATAHGLLAGRQVNITGAQTPLAISSLIRVGIVGKLVTSTAHDLSNGFSSSVQITGATEAEFNGTFTLSRVVDRYTVEFVMPDTGATTATGTPLLLNGASALQQYNGLYAVTNVVDPTTFQFAVSAALPSPAYGSPMARTLPRISAMLSEDLIVEAYTRQSANALWAFVVLGDSSASKSRLIESDATDNIQRTDFMRQQVIQPFTIYVVVPSSGELAGRFARDICEEVFPAILRSVLGLKFDSLLTIGTKGPVQFVGHGFAAYQKSFYIHAYQFQQVVDVSFGDTVGYDLDVAFRDISLSLVPQQGNQVEVMTARFDIGTLPSGIATYILTYLASSGGAVSGSTMQTVYAGGSGTEVIAVPDGTHGFVWWDDGVLTANRTDTGVVADHTTTAIFSVLGWSQVGSGLSIPITGAQSIAHLNNTDVAFIASQTGSIGAIETYRFNYATGTWSKIGNSFSLASVSAPSITSLNSTDVAVFDSATHTLRTYRWDGTNWALVGVAFSIVASGYICAIGTNAVAFVDTTNALIKTYAWDGTNWSLLGASLSVPGASLPAMAHMGSGQIAYIDFGNKQLRTYQWSGSAWTQLGASLSIPGIGFPALAYMGSSRVALIDGVTGNLATYAWSGSAWSSVGSPLTIPAFNYPSLAFLSNKDIAFIDNSNDQLRTYRYV